MAKKNQRKIDKIEIVPQKPINYILNGDRYWNEMGDDPFFDSDEMDDDAIFYPEDWREDEDEEFGGMGHA